MDSKAASLCNGVLVLCSNYICSCGRTLPGYHNQGTIWACKREHMVFAHSFIPENAIQVSPKPLHSSVRGCHLTVYIVDLKPFSQHCSVGRDLKGHPVHPFAFGRKSS